MNVYECIALTGGGANALDAISWSVAVDDDMAFVTASQRFYVFRYDIFSFDAEDVSAHPYTIKPDDAGANPGRWKEATAAIIESDFDHDSLSGYVANEHIDWTASSNNFATTGSLTISNSVDTYPLDIDGSYAAPQYARIAHSENQHIGLMIQRLEGGGSYNSTWYMNIPSSNTFLRWYHGAGGTVMTLNPSGDLWIKNDCSALTFTDRTPMFAGDAAGLIKNIKAKPDTVNAGQWGELDHDTLPIGVLVERIERDKDDKPITVQRRNLSNMVSLLTRGVQELVERVEILESR